MSTLFRPDVWLNNFFSARGLSRPDGRHLFAYHISADEFATLEAGLRDLLNNPSKYFDNPILIWKKSRLFNALIALYASAWWQQCFDGSKWTYALILERLGIDNRAALTRSILREIISGGFSYWGIELNSEGLRYIGAIAREAGIPQRLLSENNGRIGYILHIVTREAIRAQADRALVRSWIKSYENALPRSIKADALIDLMADSVGAIIDIKNSIKSTDLESALKELDENFPNWKSRFPLPLYDNAARRLLESLLEDATSVGQPANPGRRIVATRRLIRTTDDDWLIEARVELPQKIRIDWDSDKPRLLALQISAGDKKYSTTLKKYPDKDCYYSKSESFSFRGANAAREIALQYATQTASRKKEWCSGGAELDEDLPWIFEDEEGDYIFRQQGGGAVRGNKIYAAVPRGWEVEHGTREGALSGFERLVYRIDGSGKLKNGDLVFAVKGGTLRREEYIWRGNRFWEIEIPRGSRIYLGAPQPAIDEEGVLRTPQGEKMWKTPDMLEYSRLPIPSDFAGPAEIWFKARTGESLRDRILILPANATISLEATADDKGRVRFKNWRAAAAAPAREMDGIESRCETYGKYLDLWLEARPGVEPPSEIEVNVYWRESSRPARVLLPFPRKSARLFSGSGSEIPPGSRLSATALYGTRLRCVSPDPREMSLRIEASGGKYIEYPLETRDGGATLNLIDWQGAILEILAMESGIDASVSLTVFFDGKKMASWQIARYEGRVARDECSAFLDPPDFRGASENGSSLKALLLSEPDAAIELPETALDPEKGRTWEIEKYLRKDGPWLIYNDEEGKVLRPLLWTVSGKSRTPDPNKLQAAIAAATPESREDAFRICLAEMEQSVDSPEWKTLLALFDKTWRLPLPALEIWKQLVRFPAVMALIALHPEINFERVISRIDAELPFLWQSISKKDWENAGRLIKNYYERMLPKELAESVWSRHAQIRMEELGAANPFINAILRLSIASPEDEKERRAAKSYFTLNMTANLLFSGETSEAQKLLRGHANEEWPNHFQFAREFMPPETLELMNFPDDWRGSVFSLPIALTLRAYAFERILPPSFFNDPVNIFQVRKHTRFDEDWFERASSLTAYCCLAEDF